jgi:predicted enzyme related to lactoylglutathione lyase
MARFTSHPPGTPCWVDLMSPDVDASKDFYTAVFGWDAEDQFDGDQRVYTLFTLDGLNVAGLGGQPPGSGAMPPVWNTYVAVADCSETAEAAEAAGGSVVMAPMQVMTAGEMAVLADPGGAVFSVWKAGDHIGAQICNEPDTYSWNELMSRDVDNAKSFYSAVFGWTYDEMDMGEMGTYSVIAGGEHNGLGGLMAMPPDMPDMVPNHWAVYFTVADLAATLEKVTGNGGQIVVPAMAIPGVGTMAHVHDPAGGSFALLQPEST